MGRAYRFDCLRCNYSARVCAGEARHSGFATRTIICLDCREVYDVVSALRLETRWIIWRGRHRIGGAPLALSAEQIRRIEDRLNLPRELLPQARRLELHPISASPMDRGAPRRWVKIKPICPVNSKHRIRSWSEPVKCPRCHAPLERSPYPFRVWE